MVSRKMIENMLARLNHMLQRPATAFVQVDGRNIGQVGHLCLDYMQPGDSKHPYCLEEIANDGGGVRQPLGGRRYSARGMFDVLCAIEAALDGRLLIGGAK